MDSSLSSSPSSENASRSSILRQQREAALRRRQSLVPPRRDSHGGDSGRPTSRRMSLGAINAIADVMAWEEAKTKERIEARIRKDEDRRVGEAKKRPEVEAEDFEAFKPEKLDLKRSLEAKGRAEAECKLDEDARKQAEANAEVQRREKERFEDLERRLAEAERAKSEAEQLAERALMFERRHYTERQIRTSFQGSDGSGNDSDANICQSTMVASDHVPPDRTGINSGYERYLATFHQPTKVNDGSIAEHVTVISESIDGLNIHVPTHAIADDNVLQIASTSKQTVTSGSNNKGYDSGRLLRSQEIVTGKQPASTSDDDAYQKKVSNSLTSKIYSLPQISSIESINLDDPKVMRSFLMKPCPKGEGMVHCSVRRNKGLFPEYRMYLNRSNSKTETFLLTSKKRVGNKSSNYLISMSRNDHDKSSDGILGKLRSNFFGTEYNLYDHGKNPDYDDAFCEENNDGEIRIELGAILYANSTSLGSKGPRKMNMCINKVDDDGYSLKVWQPKTRDDERMMTCLKKQTSSIDKLVCFESKPPIWNNDVGAHVLYFNGKATMASVKNFQLCTQNDEQRIIMQFGRIDKDEFSLEVQWPMSLFQAFAVALSSFDSKLGCD